MSEFDLGLINSMGYGLVTVAFDSVQQHYNLVDFIRSEIMDDNGTVDIPMYIIEIKGEFVGAVTGLNTEGELRHKLLQVHSTLKPL